ncbi:carbohydrate esterase family 16 protein [Amniculicola lignicola CBS 123094]|uniref:Carbohydrate esterase family 16 protein n=1 Tax=Amniculicola lignicola CBS 123094 TaxID=1392246 RepID=A0A6A5WJ21_9PLEO|nr:carbohydrate esterase family 16 protein [Amniculicola lignicola CBS 123094]
MKGSIGLCFSLSALAGVAQATWTKWKDVEYLFVFGDSYTQTGFNINGTQPSPSNPMGNPPYPGWTSSNGPNWVDFLTYTYNASRLQTYNLAYGGATVDAALVTPYAPTVLSLKNQVQDLYLPKYAKAPFTSKWNGDNSLFLFWIGINDVGNSWWLNNGTLYDEIFRVYGDLVDSIYDSGARNFVFLTVPPVNLAPLTLASGEWSVENEGLVIADWNKRVKGMAEGLVKGKSGVKTWVHDTWKVFNDVIKDPKAFEQTQGLKNVMGFCKAYSNGAPTWYTKDASCAYAVNEYFWLNDLHPTFPVHNATAADIVALLGKE